MPEAIDTETRLLDLARNVQAALNTLYDEPIAGDAAFDQEGLRNGLEIVTDYVEHSEHGLAFEHLLYMITEPDLAIKPAELDEVAAIGRTLGFADHSWSRIRTV